MIPPSPFVATLAPYALADPVPPGAISLSQNESAFPPSPRAVHAGQAALAGTALYPDPDWTDVRAAITAVHPLDPADILCGAGSMELIGALIRAYAGPGDEVLGAEFGYLFVATACRQSGATYVRARERDFTVSVDALLAAVTSRTRILFLCNPGNPTGTRLVNAEILRLRAALPKRVMLVVDQAYGEFDDQDQAPVFALASSGNTVILRSFSKAYGLAGARAGWGVFPGDIATQTRKLLNPNNVAAVSQAMAAAAMRDQDHMRGVVLRTARIRDAFRARLLEAGYATPVSHTNFVLIPFDGVAACRAADSALKARGLLLRDMGGYGLSHALRATIAAPEAMAEVAQTLAGLST